jgi:hypothetical protein
VHFPRETLIQLLEEAGLAVESVQVLREHRGWPALFGVCARRTARIRS